VIKKWCLINGACPHLPIYQLVAGKIRNSEKPEEIKNNNKNSRCQRQQPRQKKSENYRHPGDETWKNFKAAIQKPFSGIF